MAEKPGAERDKKQRSNRPVDSAEPASTYRLTRRIDTATDLSALRAAVVDAAGVGNGLWFSYLFALFYLGIAAGSVNHVILFLQRPVKLPFLGVDLSLIGFFTIGPVLILILHAHILLQIGILARKARDFDNELSRQIGDAESRERIRRELPNNVFVQLLAGPLDVRTGFTGLILGVIVQISLILAPLALLVFFLLQFLPYHDAGITWLHRVAVVSDLGLLWVMGPPIFGRSMTSVAWRDFKRPSVTMLAAVSLAPVLLVLTIATFPGEWPHDHLPSLRFLPAVKSDDGRLMGFRSREGSSLHDWLVGGDVDLLTRRPISIWSNRLVLPGIDVVDHSKLGADPDIATLPETVSLRGRHLEGAILIGARLPKADLTGAYLSKAWLVDADLRGAKLTCATIVGISGGCAQLQEAVLWDANLEAASLEDARLDAAMLWRTRLRGAKMRGSVLRGAMLADAKMEGADLTYSALQGSVLDGANLQGARLDNANLLGATLDKTLLQGAWLVDADLQGASLVEAHLEGAILSNAQLQGAVLDRADLSSANLRGAGLQGASLDQTNVAGADLDRTRVWRSSGRIIGAGAYFAVDNSSDYRGLDCDPLPDQDKPCAWTVATFNYLQKKVDEIPDDVPRAEKSKQSVRTRISALNPSTLFENEVQSTRYWTEQNRLSPEFDAYAKQNSEAIGALWRKIGCDAVGGPYAIRGLMVHFPLRAQMSAPEAKLAAEFLDTEKCLAARDLSAADKLNLLRIVRRGPAKSPPAGSATTPGTP